MSIIFSKWDLIQGISETDTRTSVLNYTSNIKRDIHRRFKDSFYNLQFFEIAARPAKRTMEFAFGVDILLNTWVANNLLQRFPVPDYSIFSAEIDREFDRFQYLPILK